MPRVGGLLDSIARGCGATAMAGMDWRVRTALAGRKRHAGAEPLRKLGERRR